MHPSRNDYGTHVCDSAWKKDPLRRIEMGDRPGRGHAFQRQRTSRLPQRNCGFTKTCGGEVMRQQLGFGRLDPLGKRALIARVILACNSCLRLLSIES